MPKINCIVKIKDGESESDINLSTHSLSWAYS